MDEMFAPILIFFKAKIDLDGNFLDDVQEEFNEWSNEKTRTNFKKGTATKPPDVLSFHYEIDDIKAETTNGWYVMRVRYHEWIQSYK